MSYESYEERKVREARDKYDKAVHRLTVATAELALAQAELEADRRGFADDDD